jgi:hypothetical protein
LLNDNNKRRKLMNETQFWQFKWSSRKESRMMKKPKPSSKSKCSKKNGNVKLNWPNSKNSKVSTNKRSLIKFCTKKTSKSESTRKDNENKKRKETEK